MVPIVINYLGDILEGEILFNEELYYYEKGSIVSK